MSDNKKLKISIITVVKNKVNTIERAIKSVINQNYSNFEYIIIDANSDDGTSEKIKKYNEKISTVIREDDRGIWDAMNKGLKYVNGI